MDRDSLPSRKFTNQRLKEFLGNGHRGWNSEVRDLKPVELQAMRATHVCFISQTDISHFFGFEQRHYDIKALVTPGHSFTRKPVATSLPGHDGYSTTPS